MSSLDRFLLKLANDAKNAEKLMSLTIRDVGLQALRGVVLKTRVVTGRTRGNWQTSIGTPLTGTLERLDPSGAQAIGQGSGVIKQVKPFDTIWLVNNVPWIQNLEDLDHMVDLTVQEIMGQFNL